jgi:hypothetical protein
MVLFLARLLFFGLFYVVFEYPYFKFFIELFIIYKEYTNKEYYQNN